MAPSLDGPVTPSSPGRLSTPSTDRGEGGARQRWRLLLMSSKARHVDAVTLAILPSVVLVTYKYDSSTLDHILAEVARTLAGRRVESLAMLLHGSELQLHLCGPGEKVVSSHSVSQQASVREFFSTLVNTHLDRTLLHPRLDFLAAHPAHHPQHAEAIAADLAELLQLPVHLVKDLQGSEVEVERWGPEGTTTVPLGQLYFHPQRLKEALRAAGNGANTRVKDLEREYEKIRVIGKGSFGSAVLYRRLKDEALVVIKEINMLELSASERQMALNEINVLALLDHPNIVSYMDSFERDAILCIEMEYADGGSLAQYLTQRMKRIDEREVLAIFHQITAALSHMHQHHILHRDLKTANIFLTKEGQVKVGDFGISKMMSTHSVHAHTVLGTPYYISPEMCEGKEYDEKSDIWALGCILYEMACLQKTFEGSNLPALVNKIMKGQFAPIRGNYSPGFKQLVRDLLQRDPEFRPTAAEVLNERLPELLAQVCCDGLNAEEVNEQLRHSIEVARQTQVSRSSRPPRSVVYHLKVYDSSISLGPVPLPARTRVKELAVSNTHLVLLTSECLVYTWGEGKKGQLGHEALEVWRGRPGVVEALRGKAVTRVCAGDGFSVFASDNGIVMTCGDGTFGCLGHNDWNSSTKPKLIERLLAVDVCGISCGSHHVVVVAADGVVYAWGRGEGGRLGTGSEDDACHPTEIELPGDVAVTSVRCGGDGTLLVTEQGSLLACGNNTYNKLGLNQSPGLFSMNFKKEVPKALVATRVRSIGCRVVDVAMGPSHTAVLTEMGQVLTFGRNSEGQLGRGNTRSTTRPVLVRAMANKVVTMIQCGSTYTVAGTMNNALYLWGTRAVSPLTRPNTQEGFTNTWGQRSVLGSAAASTNSTSSTNTSSHSGGGGDGEPDGKEKSGSAGGSDSGGSRRCSSSSESDSSQRRQHRNIDMRDVLLQPQEILALYASQAQISKGETLSLAGIHCQNQSIFLVVDTTVPLPRAGSSLLAEMEEKRRKEEKPEEKAEEKPGKKIKEEEEEEEEEKDEKDDNLNDSMGPVPDWLRAELEEAEVWSSARTDRGRGRGRGGQGGGGKEGERRGPTTHSSNRPTPASKQPFSKARGKGGKGGRGEGEEAPFHSPFVPSPRPAPGGRGRRVRQARPKGEKRMKEEEKMAKEKEEALNQEIEKLRTELHRQQEQQKSIIDQRLKEMKEGEMHREKESGVCSLM